MAYAPSEIRAGIFILVAVILLSVGIFTIGGFGKGGDVEYSTIIDDARFIRTGDRVTIAGFQVGVIRSVELDPASSSARIHFTIDRELRGECSITLKQDGLMGARYLEIEGYRASSEVRVSGDIPGRTQPDLNRLVAEIRPLIETFTDVEFRDQLRKMVATAEEVADEIYHFVQHLDQVVAENSETFGELLADGRDFMDHLHQLVQTNEQMITRIVMNLSDATEVVPPVLEATLLDAQRALDQIRGAAAELDSMVGENRANIFAVTAHAREIAYQIEMLSRKLRANPAVLIWGSEEDVQTSTVSDETDRRRAGRMPRYDQRP